MSLTEPARIASPPREYRSAGGSSIKFRGEIEGWAGPISTVILIVVLAMLAAPPLVADAQPAGKVPRVAYLSASSAASATWGVEAFRQGLRELGYIEGRNILIEYRWADGRFDRLPALAAELTRLTVDVIVASSTPAESRKNSVTHSPR